MSLVQEPHAVVGAMEDAKATHHEAQAAIEIETKMTFFEAVRLYPAATFWALFFSLGLVMTAFDVQLLGSLYATPAFQQDFGYLYEGEYIVSAAWQTGLSMGAPIGQVLGSFIASYPMEFFGRKKTFGACVILSTGCVFIQFFARSLPVLLVGELLAGLVFGTYTVIAPTYASEVCPTPLRGVLTSCLNLCFVAGQLIANGVIKGTSTIETHWAYSIPFAVQWIWPVIILVCLPFAPESPWWLQRQGRLEEAEKALRSLSSPDADTKAALALIIDTNRVEMEYEAGSTYIDCIKRVNRYRTEIAVGVYCLQILSGIYLFGYATYFFTIAGLATDESFDMSVGILALGFVGTCLSWFIIVRFGRRVIFTYGLVLLALLMFIIGILDCLPDYDDRPGLVWAQAILMLVWNFVYSMTLGPICYVILCEVSAINLRSKTIAIASASQAFLGIGMTVAIPYMINPDEANMRGKLGFFYGGLASLGVVWAWFRVPETGGRTYEELDIMFEEGVKTHSFRRQTASAA